MKFNTASFDKIKNENRNFVVSKLENGDLIKIKARSFPIIYHYGIIEKKGNDLFIIHNHPKKINSKGGNTVREALEKWVNGREIVSVEKTRLNTNDIEKLYDTLKPYKYDMINFNCEHIVNYAKNNMYASPQVLRWTYISLIGLSVYFFLKNRRI